MLYRVLATGIVLFWVVMTGMLVRSEFFGGSATRQAIPPAHVFKQIFLHEQNSDLVFYRQRQRLGLFHVQPRRDGAANLLVITGGSTLDFFGAPNQRVVLRATFELDAQQAVRRFDVSATFREPHQKDPSLGVSVDGTPPSNHYHYLIRQGDAVKKERSGTPDEMLDDPDLRTFGFDPRNVIRQAFTQGAASTVDARRSTMAFNGETIDTYLVTFHGMFESTLQTTQQGQILAFTTGAGYDFYDETLTP